MIQGGIQDFEKIYGISRVNALKVLASLTLGTRLYREKISKINLETYSSIDIYNYYSYLFKSYKNERLIALFINRLGSIYKEVLLASGTSKVIYLALDELTKYFDKNISKIVLLHNHLSESSTPSKEDIEATLTVEKKLKSYGIILLDHLILSKDNYFSFYDNKLLKIRWLKDATLLKYSRCNRLFSYNRIEKVS